MSAPKVGPLRYLTARSKHKIFRRNTVIFLHIDFIFYIILYKYQNIKSADQITDEIKAHTVRYGIFVIPLHMFFHNNTFILQT